MTLDHCLVVTLVHVHERQFHALRQLAGHRQVDVLIERLASPAHMREVQLHVHAILAAKLGLALEVVAHLGLIGPLAVGKLGGIGV